MKRLKKTHKVLLVGRTNVGKSTLFNRILGKLTSIVFDQEGVTRDYIEEEVSWKDRPFTLVDTGGLSFKKVKKQNKETRIQSYIQENVIDLVAKGHVLFFVCDGKNGLTLEDQRIAKILHKTKRPVILLVNKADNSNALAENMHEFNKLGFDTIIPVSAIHATGINEALNAAVETLEQYPPQIEEDTNSSYNIAIVGRPNVGKSSLMNLLTKRQRSIVSDIAGTTREAISEKVFFADDLLQITDTAGIRKKSRVDEPLESLMVKSSLSSIRTADVIILVIDVTEGKIADQELKLLFYAVEQHKPLIILYNKVDLVENDSYTLDQFLQSMDKYNFILKKFPPIAVSCLTQKNVHKIFGQIQKVLDRCKQDIDSVTLDETIKNALARKPLYHKRVLLKLLKIKQNPSEVPSFTLYVNFPEWFGPTQLGFIENTLRKNYDFQGCPIRFTTQKV